jgi:hypothetical protein
MMPRRKIRAPDPVSYRFVVVASFAQLEGIVRQRTGMAFIWPDEGAFEADPGDPPATIWRFNEQHADFEPLWVDPSTANLMLQVHGALTRTDLRARLVERVARDRGTFGQLVEFCWSKATTQNASFTSG